LGHCFFGRFVEGSTSTSGSTFASIRRLNSAVLFDMFFVLAISVRSAPRFEALDPKVF
jgi:hypothetical protein